MSGAGIRGPFFVSIGDSDKLNVFLDNNPNVPRKNLFVDDYSFKAYKSVGFGSLNDPQQKEQVEKAENLSLKAPNLGFGQWMTYLFNVARLSPVPKDLKFGVSRRGSSSGWNLCSEGK